MSRRSVESSAQAVIGQFGNSAAHYLYPDEFEYHFIAFEVVDSLNNVVDYMAFPVNPESIIYNVPATTTVERTFGGVVTNKSSSFNPKNITLMGNFGRRFKFVLGGRPLNFIAVGFNFNGGLSFRDFSFRANEFNGTLKTGYGCIKVLERIIERSKQLDENGNPYKVYFYNASLNQQFMVEFENDYDFNQNLGKNMIWSYNLRIKAVADLNDIAGFDRNVLANLLLLSNLSKIGSNLLTKLNRRISGGNTGNRSVNTIIGGN